MFTVISEHICFLLLVFMFLHFLVVGSVRKIKLTHVGFRALVKIAPRIVSCRGRTQVVYFTSVDYNPLTPLLQFAPVGCGLVVQLVPTVVQQLIRHNTSRGPSAVIDASC